MMEGLLLVFVRAIIIVIIGAITYIVVPWIKQYRNKWFVAIAVKAAEFAYKEVAKAGPQKRNYVIEWLNKRGIHIDRNILDVLIDSTLQEISKQFKEEEKDADPSKVINC